MRPVALAVVVLAILPTRSTAQTYTWTGATAAWGTAANWSPAGTPTTSSTVVFGATGTTVAVNLGGTRQVQEVQFTDPARSYALSGGTLALSSNGTLSLSGAAATVSAGVVLNGFNTVGVTSGTLTLSGVVSGGAQFLFKTGAGTAYLSQANTYTGVTYIGGGVLQVDVLANAGVASGIGASSAGGTNLQIDGGTLRYTGATAAGTDRLFNLASGTIDASGGGAVAFTATGSLGFVGNGNRTLTLTGTNTGTNTLAPIFGNQGNNTSSLTKSGSGTWRLTGASTYTGPTTITGGVLEATTLANAGTASSIGRGTTAAASVVLDGGTLRYVGAAAASTDRRVALGPGGGTLAVTTNGATLDWTNTAPVTFTTPNAATTLTLTAGTGTTLGLTAAVADNGTGATSVSLGGGGTVVLSGANTYSGQTLSSVQFLRAGAVGAFSPNSAIIFIGRISLNGFDQSIRSIRSLQVGSYVANDSATPATVTIGANGVSSEATSVSFTDCTAAGGGPAAPLGLTKVGAGTLTLFNGAGAIINFTGPTTITGGVLAAGSLRNGGGSSDLGASSAAAANLVLDGGTLRYAGPFTAQPSATDRLFTVGANGGGLDASGSVMTPSPGTVSFTNPGAVAFTGTGGRTLTLTGTNPASNVLAPLLGDPTGGALTVAKSGAGTWQLAGANTYTGPTTITGGVLEATTLANAGAASGIGRGTTSPNSLVIDGGTLRYVGAGNATNRRFTFGANGVGLESSGTGAVRFTSAAPLNFGTANAATTLTLGGTNAGLNQFAAVVRDNGAGATSVTKTGPGAWYLTGNNSYTGPTTVTGGTLFAASRNALSDSAVTVSAGGALGVSVPLAEVASVTGDGTVTSGIPGLGVGTFAVGGTGASTTFAGTFADGPNGETFGLTKVGAGTLTVTGTAHAYNGPTNINGGTLRVDGALGVGTAVTVSGGGTLAGSGSAEGFVTIADGGTVSPGNSPGTLTLGDMTFAGGGNYNWQISDARGAAGLGYDTLTVNGVLDITATAADPFRINLWSLLAANPDRDGPAANFDPARNYLWTIADTSDGVTGFDPAAFAVVVAPENGTGGFRNGYGGTFSVLVSGNDLALAYTAPVPEPGVVLAVAAAGLVLAGRGRRRADRAGPGA